MTQVQAPAPETAVAPVSARSSVPAMPRVRAAIIGVGGMSYGHIRTMLKLNTEIVAVCDPSESSYEKAADVFEAQRAPVPPNVPELAQLLADYAGRIDCAFIITPHAYHHLQAKACLESGLDVLLEKPMVMNVGEAESLIDSRNKTGRHLVVAFQGSLSPQIREASRMIAQGEIGELLNISGTVWQNWREMNNNTWRTVPALSGGGFLFDTGAHMLNTVADLANQDFIDVAAWTDNRGIAVELIGVVMARLRSGALVTINACGETVESCTSDIRVFGTKGIIRTGQWGERLDVQREYEAEPLPMTLPPSEGVWEQFLKVRAGEMKNPSPPEIGLRMARLWDAIKESAEKDGAKVRTGA